MDAGKRQRFATRFAAGKFPETNILAVTASGGKGTVWGDRDRSHAFAVLPLNGARLPGGNVPKSGRTVVAARQKLLLGRTPRGARDFASMRQTRGQRLARSAIPDSGC